MQLQEAMNTTKKCQGGWSIRLTFLPGVGEEETFTPTIKTALEALRAMNMEYYFMDGKDLESFDIMLSQGCFGARGREVTVALIPDFLGHRRQFLEPLVDALESLKAI